MKSNFSLVLLAGIAGTIIMTLFMYIVAAFGGPELNPATMLAQTFQIPVFIGWILHFMVGITFSALYYLLLVRILKFKGWVWHGLILGVVAFLIAQVSFAIMGAIGILIPDPQGAPALIMAGSIVGHLLFGLGVVWSKTTGLSNKKQES